MNQRYRFIVQKVKNVTNRMFKGIDLRIVKSIWIIACIISFQLAVQAQNAVTLRGQVFDKTNNTPLSFASVFIPNSGTGVITNEFGEFTYHLPDHSDTETINISFGISA